MASPYLWTPSLEPRTVINSSKDVMMSETAALDKEEEEYEAQLLAIKIKSKRAPIVGVYKMRPNDYMDDDLPLMAEEDDDSEYDEGDDDDDDEDDEEEEDLDDDIEELDEEIVEDDVEEESEYQYPNDPSTPVLTSTSAPEDLEFLPSTESLPPHSPNIDSGSISEVFLAAGAYVDGLNFREEIGFDMEQ